MIFNKIAIPARRCLELPRSSRQRSRSIKTRATIEYHSRPAYAGGFSAEPEVCRCFYSPKQETAQGKQTHWLRLTAFDFCQDAKLLNRLE